MNDFGDAHAGLVEHFVARLKAFLHRGFGRAFALELFVEDHDHRVDLVLELLDAGFGRAHAAGAFEAEGLGDDGHRQDAELLGDFGDDGRGARTRAAAHAGRDEEEMRPADGGFDLLALFLRRGGADFRTGARTEPGAAELNVDVRLRALQRLMVRVGRDEFDPLGAVVDHVFDGVSAATAHADDLDIDNGIGTGLQSKCHIVVPPTIVCVKREDRPFGFTISCIS